MTSKGTGDSLTFGGWTDPKGLLTAGLFLALAFISEYFMVSFFVGSGLTETTAYPLPVSPLFHLLPLTVILVLVSSWMYLTKHLAMRPHRISPAKVPKARRRHPRRRTKTTQNVMGTIKKFFSKISSALTRSSGASSAPQRFSFGRVALEGTVTVLAFFLLSIILLSVLVYPNLFTDFAVDFYSKTSLLQDFMQSLADALVSISSGLDSIAPAFRNAFENLVPTKTLSLTERDILWRYIFCQNAAAWVSAISALASVKYFSTTYRSSK
ncbi:MAG TPA: hypothetical protein ENN36_00275 [Candidatus Bathyarchaeota archaeon]|nr:hypothetical protein [Candidatus Bathyarchaeota archaeon]